MPYRNIVFVKLEKRLLNDHRWYLMSEPAQLLYIKLILLAAESYNKIPLNDIVLREAVRSRISIEEFKKCLDEIESNFPKLKRNRYVRYFAEFETKTNYIPKKEIPRKSQGLPKVGADKDQDKDQEEEKKKPPFSFLKQAKTELSKMASPAMIAKWLPELDDLETNQLRVYLLGIYKDADSAWQKAQEIIKKVKNV